MLCDFTTSLPPAISMATGRNYHKAKNPIRTDAKWFEIFPYSFKWEEPIGIQK